MGITISIPTPLRRFTGERADVEAQGATVGEVMKDLVRQHPALERHLYGDDGALRSFVNLFLNDEDIRYREREATPVAAGDTLSIIPSIAGGGGR
jgi:sulfur-carrier protein